MKELAFDCFLREAQHEKIAVTVRGERYLIEARIPALVPLMMARAERLSDEKRRNEEFTRLVFEAADVLFGREQMDRLCRQGLSAQELALLVQKCFELINQEEAGDGEELSDEDSRTSLPVTGKK